MDIGTLRSVKVSHSIKARYVRTGHVNGYRHVTQRED